MLSDSASCTMPSCYSEYLTFLTHVRRLRLFSVCLSVTTLASSVSVYTCLPHDTHGFILQSDL